MKEKHFCLQDLLDISIAALVAGCDVIHVDHSAFGKDENRLKYNLYGLARSHAGAKAVVTQLSNFGYYMVEHKDGVSVFLNFGRIDLYDRFFLGRGCARHGRIYYSIENISPDVTPKRALVVFSSVADFPYNSDINRRCFYKNFPGVGKYIPYDTVVVRLSDIGGVVGSFYLNNNFNSDVENDIQDFLRQLEQLTGVCKADTILYGVSKGGTGALFHGVLGGFSFVSVDPIVSDEHHEKKYGDSHFTQGTFPAGKQKVFEELMLKPPPVSAGPGYIITSCNSPVFPYINGLRYPGGVSVLDVGHKNIKDHPDVGPNTINILLLLINAVFYKVKLTGGVFSHSGLDDGVKNDLPGDWKAVLDEKGKEGHQVAYDYLDFLRREGFDLTVDYYWRLAINLRALKKFDECRGRLEEAFSKFPDNIRLKESEGALFFDTGAYKQSFDMLSFVLARRRLSERLFAKLLFAAIIACKPSDVLKVCDEYLATHLMGNDRRVYEFISNFILPPVCDFDLVKSFGFEFSHFAKRNGLSSLQGKVWGFFRKKILVLHGEVECSAEVDWPNSKCENFLLQACLVEEKLYALFSTIAYGIFLNNTKLKNGQFSSLDGLFFYLWQSRQDFLSEVRNLPFTVQEGLVHVLFKMKFFDLAYEVRKYYRDAVLGDGRIKQRLLAYADTGRAFDMNENIKAGGEDWLQNVIPCLMKRPLAVGLMVCDERDKFYDLLAGKRIAIVGPVNLGECSGDEIDSYDVVVRFNFRGRQRLGDARVFGRKTTIGYYYAGDIPSEIDAVLFDGMSELSCAVVTQFNINRAAWLGGLGNRLRARYDVYPPSVNPLLLGYGNAVQRALIDILRFPYGEIKLFNANLYFSDAVDSSYGRKPPDFGNLFCYHEPMSNFNYIKAVYGNGWVDVDAGLKKVLDIGEGEYVANLQRNYGRVSFA